MRLLNFSDCSEFHLISPGLNSELTDGGTTRHGPMRVEDGLMLASLSIEIYLNNFLIRNTRYAFQNLVFIYLTGL